MKILSHRYFIRLSYLGTHYHGWQTQKNAKSIQSLLNEALTVILRMPVKVTGAGRTDTGVHAREYFAHFDFPSRMEEKARKKLVFSLNGFLPQDIGIREILPVKPDANARFSAISRTYQYRIVRLKDPFEEQFAWFFPHSLDADRMNAAARIILKTSDFSSFMKSPSDSASGICKVTEAYWKEEGDILVFTITADRFLRNMVRAITGTMIDIGRGKISLRDLERIIRKKDRSAAGYSVPACGLYLVSVRYPEEIFL